jgi:protein-S-isoprenylcysteine O-methyltransferase Ste14
MPWIYVGLNVAIALIGAALIARTDPEMIEERRQVKEGVKRWDQVLTNIFSWVTIPTTMLVAGLDRRLGWTLDMPIAIQIGGLVAGVVGFCLVMWAMAANSFFSVYVRIQTERGHKTASGGPYRYVRHPGYVGLIASVLAIPLVLGSAWAFLPAGFGTALMILRTALEDKTLHEELNGYREYAQKIRYRLLPGIW